jgi:hypothetical protein
MSLEAVPLLVLGILFLVNNNKLVIRSLSILGIVLGILIFLIPTTLIGVCASAEMLCNSVMRPILILCGILVVVASSVGLWLSFNKQDQPV